MYMYQRRDFMGTCIWLQMSPTNPHFPCTCCSNQQCKASPPQLWFWWLCPSAESSAQGLVQQRMTQVWLLCCHTTWQHRCCGSPPLGYHHLSGFVVQLISERLKTVTAALMTTFCGGTTSKANCLDALSSRLWSFSYYGLLTLGLYASCKPLQLSVSIIIPMQMIINIPLHSHNTVWGAYYTLYLSY